jgi:hypothetical protein
MKFAYNYQRLATLPLWQGLQFIRSGVDEIIFSGERVGVNSLRLQTFLFKGVRCYAEDCPLEGEFWAIERCGSQNQQPSAKHPKAGRYHLNLYAQMGGREILMTHDHVIARSLGGKDVLSNVVTMCDRHNTQKSHFEGWISEMLRKAKEMPYDKFLVYGKNAQKMRFHAL